ncbi:hypothetical protein JCM33374_g3589 [Metschnikowia sp. JCM 33374]|nr:hypothetical protein JCM33374_g3589 [Metschnikowia sp. JCM 33374]
MSDQSPMFNIPPSRPQTSKLSLSIPSPLSLGHTDPPQTSASYHSTPGSDASALNAPVPLPYIPKPVAAQAKPRRKPVPIDFTKIDGSHSHVPEPEASHQPPPAGPDPSQPSAIGRAIHAAPSHAPTGIQIPKETPICTASLDSLTPDEWNMLANSNRIVEVNKLGEGNGGSVSKCVLEGGSPVFALKLISADPNPDIQKQIIRELQYNRLCHSPNIVKYYGTFMVEKHSMIGIAMEFMGGGTLDAIYKRVLELDPTNRVSEKVLGKVADSVLKGLSYLHMQKIIHRDIKPVTFYSIHKGMSRSAILA